MISNCDLGREILDQHYRESRRFTGMDGAVSLADRYKISRFIIFSRAVHSGTMPRKISSPYAIGVTDENIYANAKLRFPKTS